jgi:hypothetical protein
MHHRLAVPPLLLTLTLVAALGVAGCGSSKDSGASAAKRSGGGSGSESGGSCDGVVEQVKVDGQPALRHCGPAKASADVGGSTIAATGGTCERTDDYVSVNVGTQLQGATTPDAPAYIGLNVGRTPASDDSVPTAGKDGSYGQGLVIAIVDGSKTYSVSKDVVVTLEGGRTKGTFEGSTVDGAKVTGSFSC